MTTGLDILVVSHDAVLLRQLERVRRPEWMLRVTDLDGLESADEPAAIVADLQIPGIIEHIGRWKDRWPRTFIVASLIVPSKDLWEQADTAGADVVVNRGALPQRFVPGLDEWLEQPGGRRMRLFGLQDVAGRLGLVHRLTADDGTPIAVYRVRGQIFAVADRCPHAGATLSEGTLDEAILT